MRSRIFQMGWKILDWIFPPACAGCGKWGSKYCEDCLKNTRLISGSICQVCGDALTRPGQMSCRRCRENAPAFSAVRSWAFFEEPLQSAIHRMKYRQDIGLALVLSGHLVEMLLQYHWPIDLVVALPLDKGRLKERGYNQAALLARPIAWEVGIQNCNRAVVRNRRTRQQVGLSAEERIANVAGAFLAREDLVSGKAILVVDDVITTGSTLNACAVALKQAGARAVYGLTLARSAHI